jgi:hypothetical protein
VDAYELAGARGANGAGTRLEALRTSARQVRFFPDRTLSTCSGVPDPRLEVEMVRATIDEGNSAWMAGVGYRGTAERYPAFFDGRWLSELTAEVEDLRRNNQTRQTTLREIEYTSIAVLDDAAAVETVETWDDRTLSDNGQLVRDVSGRLRQRYDLRKVDGQWKIVDAQIIRG